MLNLLIKIALTPICFIGECVDILLALLTFNDDFLEKREPLYKILWKK